MPAIISEREWNPEALSAARDWLLDCYNDDDSQEDIRELSPSELFRAVSREYGGGWEQFLADANLC